MSYYVDEVMVERLLREGPQSAANRTERRVAAEQLLRVRPDLTNRDIARRVGLGEDTIGDYRRALGLTSPAKTHAAPTGVTRAKIKELILADPMLPATHAGLKAGVSKQVGLVHYRALVAAGELPPRGETRGRRR